MPTIAIEGKKCFYQDLGSGFPVLFGHSYLWSSDMWKPQLKALSQEFRCIAPDLWDHGHSDSSPTPPSIESLADHAWKFMQALGIDEFAIVGLSVGGMWGARLALDHPQAVKALVLMDTHVGCEPPETQKRYFGMIDSLEKEGKFSQPLLDQIIPLFFSPTTMQEKPNLPAKLREDLSNIPQKNVPGVAALGRAIFSRNNLMDRLPSLPMPTLVIVGKDDRPRPPHEARDMASRLTNGALLEIDQAGHISNLEQVEQVNCALSEFLTRNLIGALQ